MTMIMKPANAICQNYNEIADLCKKTQKPVYLTQNEKEDLVVMDVMAYDQMKKQLESMSGEGLQKHDLTDSYKDYLSKKLTLDMITSVDNYRRYHLMKRVRIFASITMMVTALCTFGIFVMKKYLSQ